MNFQMLDTVLHIFCKCEFEVQFKKVANMLLTTAMFNKNQNQTTEDAPFVSHTACIKQTQHLLFSGNYSIL